MALSASSAHFYHGFSVSEHREQPSISICTHNFPLKLGTVLARTSNDLLPEDLC